MIATRWIPLPERWLLSGVQAGLQVVVAVLCTTGIFVFSRICWQTSTLGVVRNRAVALSSLITITTIGEAYDITAFMRHKIFSPRHWRLLAQIIVVFGLSIATIVSGPIAKASTRMGEIVRTTELSGYLARREAGSLAHTRLELDQTFASLEQARFPLNQLLDYMPDSSVDWEYSPDQWNSSWSMACVKTLAAPVLINGTGRCDSIWTELGGLQSILPISRFRRLQVVWDAIKRNHTIIDGMVVLGGWDHLDDDMYSATPIGMSVTIAMVHLNQVGLNTNASSECHFATGQYGPSSYTMMKCDLNRLATVPDDSHIAYPGKVNDEDIMNAYIANFYPALARQSISGLAITPVTPDEMIRFYQSYMVVKDIWRRQPVQRQIRVRSKGVHLSATFLAIALLLAIFNVAGLVSYVSFRRRYRQVIRDTPKSKLAWAVQSILNHPAAASRPYHRLHLPGSVSTALKAGRTRRPISQDLRSYFERARFGAPQETGGSKDQNDNERLVALVISYPAPTSPSYGHTNHYSPNPDI